MWAVEDGQVQQPDAVKSEIWEWAKALIIAGALVLLIRFFVFAPFIVEGPSMEPNFYTGERLIVNKIIYTIRKPHRGEVVVFHAPQEKDYIKRVIALPGETIKIEKGKVYINNEELKEPYIQEAIDKYFKENNADYNANYKEMTIPDGEIFVMGDNRVNSTDSRMIGPVAYEKIIGRADIIFWPLSKLQLIKHDY
ncbi:signal peptidase I [Paenibacillus aurantius]|uniref:Signal peptidase I n=1 Tax=Paenibacillus aurantius TaxID=2918900 RepID=A0AA96LI76_9BACL|nr:signal peptidase I [Paenibacillus aurantius]WNQ13710.1 signal peptidase I [Paenibacillus aurantius]